MSSRKSTFTFGSGDIITAAHILAMKDQAVVCNVSHFDNQIQVDQLKKAKGVCIENIKPQYDRYHLQGNRSIYLLAEDRLVNSVAPPPAEPSQDGRASARPQFLLPDCSRPDSPRHPAKSSLFK